MSGRGIKVYTDEDVDPRLAIQLTRLGYDAVSTQQAGRHNQRFSDESQLLYASTEGRAILVFNVDDFMALDETWRAAGNEHHGIIIALNTTPLGELVRRTRAHLDRVEPADQRNTVIWLPG